MVVGVVVVVVVAVVVVVLVVVVGAAVVVVVVVVAVVVASVVVLVETVSVPDATVGCCVPGSFGASLFGIAEEGFSVVMGMVPSLPS